jgi:F-type H+-transporting ATPase subunit epsilon
MPPVFDLKLVAPDHLVYEGRAQSLVAPGVEGYFGVLFDHAPMIAQLRTGELKIVEEGGQTRYFAISGGFLEVSALGEVSLVADTAEAAEDVDIARAKAAVARARERIESLDEEVDHARARAALQRALTRLEIAGKIG